MKNFNVDIHYEGGWLFEIQAETMEEARTKAEQMFDDIPDSELVANLADVFIEDCREV